MSEPDGDQTEDPRVQELAAARKAIARMQRELHEARDRSRFDHGALRAIPDGVVAVDLDGRIVLLNPVAAHLTGWTEPESLGRPLAEVVHFTDEHGAAIDVLQEPPGSAGITSLLRRDGHMILVEGDVTPVFDDRRRPLGSVLIFRNVTVARRRTDELTYHANHDALTGLVNRRAFEARLRRAVATAAEQSCSHALLCFDLDRFKAVNDAAGHVAGDELLRQLAALLRTHLREGDTLARLGGDEFAVLLEDCRPEEADLVTEKIRQAVAGFEFEWLGETFRIGASIGQVEFSDGSRPAADLMLRADEMCYLAKARGRNRVEAWRHHHPTDHRPPSPPQALRQA